MGQVWGFRGVGFKLTPRSRSDATTITGGQHASTRKELDSSHATPKNYGYLHDEVLSPALRSALL